MQIDIHDARTLMPKASFAHSIRRTVVFLYEKTICHEQTTNNKTYHSSHAHMILFISLRNFSASGSVRLKNEGN